MPVASVWNPFLGRPIFEKALFLGRPLFLGRQSVIRYAKPTTVDEALALLGEARWRILAGGTDFYPAQGAKPFRENVLDINGLATLRGIAETDSHWVIGARTTWTDLVRHPLPTAFDALKQAAREVGSVQIQNVASIAGNLCNASPAADGVPALLVLDAEVELRSVAMVRHLPLEKFILGNRRTELQPGEMVTAIRVPKEAATGRSAFVKLGARRYLVISIAMAAARLTIEDGIVGNAAVAVGSCSVVAKRLASVEAALRGLPVDDALVAAIRSAAMDELSPIDDVRGSAEYRLDAAREIVARAVLGAAGHASNDKAVAA
ncbi:CO or xanthine dehydrogenase, FAD-binding subunit [Mesorhizobium escarrei]|uniref:CO or xanthine dehydrogenase, FAD-binding subunit n=1 Tax=Mesorhizobium escarrei TaxID=666018 RepID=A0ABM9EI43_9HYPH|nr:CO or xanthine dehydrogenase, FAD-binding subunit [Mesorhizobium escarrei]